MHSPITVLIHHLIALIISIRYMGGLWEFISIPLAFTIPLISELMLQETDDDMN